MIRISGGFYPRIKEENFIKYGYRTDAGATDTMLNSMTYKLSYYRFAEVRTRGENGYDNVRGAVIGRKDVKLTYFKEAYTTVNWIVRIYSVGDFPNREIPVQSRFTTLRPFNPKYYKYNRLNEPRTF